MMKTITITFGSRQFCGPVPEQYTVGDLKTDEGIRMTLGCGDNVRVLRGGVVQGDYASVSSGDSLRFETECNEKGS